MATYDPSARRPERRSSTRSQTEAAPEEESRLRTVLLDGIPDCIALILKKYTREIVASNRFARELGAIPGQTCFKTCALRDDNCPFCLAPDLWATGQSQRIEVEYRGTWYEGIWAPLSEDSYVHYIFDITERKQAEEALRESEEQLRQSQRLETVGSLAGGIAHDFNNLLTAIIGQTELLRGNHNSPTEYGDGLDEIRTAADRAAALTRQLLAFSRRQALHPRVLNLNDVADSMASLLRSLLGEQIDLVFEADPALWPVEADPGQLEQVIMNLAVNARYAMPRGGRLTIETANVELDAAYAAAHLGTQAGPHVLLEISDTGCGMDAEILTHVFEPFFTTKEAGKGTGLGLSTVYGIVKQSGGNIWAFSEPGQGSTFKICLPRAEKPIDWSPVENVGPVDIPGRGTETVLVVEDEPAVRQLTSRILSRQGYRVLAAGSPEEAIALVEEHLEGIDLILSDVILPRMSGRAMVDLLLDRPRFAPKVLYMSGYTRDALVHQGRLDEGIALLEKPFTPDGLLRKVREVLGVPFDRRPTL